MYVDIRIEALREMLREEFRHIIKEMKEADNLKLPPLSIQQLADRYEVSKATVHNWRKQKLIEGFKIGKGRFFHIDEVERNLKQYRYLEILETKGLVEKRNLPQM